MRIMKMKSRRGLILFGLLWAGLPLIAACGGADTDQASESEGVGRCHGVRGGAAHCGR